MANNKKNIKKEISRSFIAKDFDALRLDLQKFAKIYYPDNMQDFSEASLGGLLIDLAAYVGDTMTYYTDHQFRELDPLSAVETTNIERARPPPNLDPLWFRPDIGSSNRTVGRYQSND